MTYISSFRSINDGLIFVTYDHYQTFYELVKWGEAMYQYKEKYTIDFRTVKSYLEMHFVIREALDFPDYYGCNWDAFWDCLTNMVGRPIHIEIVGLDVIERKFDGAAQMMIDTLREFKHYEDDEFVHDIKIEIVDGDTCTVIC